MDFENQVATLYFFKTIRTILNLPAKYYEKLDEESNSQCFAGKPDRWWDNPTWRCLSGHVSKKYLFSSPMGNHCLKCRDFIVLTYPEDIED